MNSGYEHWWDKARYKQASTRLAKDPLSAYAWRMEEAAAYAYELVRRLVLCEANLLPEDRQILSQLPKFTVLDPFLKGVLRGALWSSWRVRPVAYSVPGFQIVPDFEHYNRPTHYAQPPFSFDLTATFDALADLLRTWYFNERERRRIVGKGRKEVIPFRVTWDRIPLLETAYGEEKNRRRERAIECAKKNLAPVIRAWTFWQEETRCRAEPGREADHHPPEPANAGYAWPAIIWKKVTLSRQLRPKRENDPGAKDGA